MKKIFLITISIFYLLNFPVLAENEPPLPEYALGYAYTPHFANLLKRTEELLSFFGMTGSKIQEFMATVLLKTSRLESLDLEKDFFYLRFNDSACPNPFLYMVHVKDKNLFIESLGKGLLGGKGFILKEQNRNQPIQEYVDEKSSFDREGYLKALEKGAADPVKFQTKISISYFIAFVDSKVFVSGNRGLIKMFLNNPLNLGNISGKTDCLFMIKPSYLYQVYGQDLSSLKEKIKPILEKNQKWLPPMIQFLENQAQKTPKMKLNLTLNEKNLEIKVVFQPDASSPSSVAPPQTSIPKSLPNTCMSMLNGYLTPSEQLLQNMQLGQNPQTQSLLQDYFQHIEGLLKLYTFSVIDQKTAFLINLSPKKGGEAAHHKLSRLLQEGYTAQIKTQGTVEEIQLEGKKFYTIFDKTNQWIGIGFKSPESFKTALLNTTDPSSSTGFDEYTKAIAGFPQEVSLFFYHRTQSNFIAGYSKRENNGAILFLRLNAKSWIDTLAQKKKMKEEKNAGK